MKKSKLVYIAHPLTTHGTIGDNFKRIDAICKELIVSNPDIVPVSPIHAFRFFDETKGDQEQVMGYCLNLLSACSELWLFGDREKSKGCMQEVAFAVKNSMTILNKAG